MNTRYKVIDFFRQKVGDQNIDENWVLNSGAYADEIAVMFILDDFFYDFRINSKGFDLRDYFIPESVPSFIGFLRRIVNKNTPKPSLTIGHLIKVAEKGEWFNPE